MRRSKKQWRIRMQREDRRARHRRRKVEMEKAVKEAKATPRKIAKAWKPFNPAIRDAFVRAGYQL